MFLEETKEYNYIVGLKYYGDFHPLKGFDNEEDAQTYFLKEFVTNENRTRLRIRDVKGKTDWGYKPIWEDIEI